MSQRLWLGVAFVAVMSARAQQIPVAGPLFDAKQALAARDYAGAQAIYGPFVKAHPDNVNAWMGLGDADLGLKRYATAEMNYRKAVALEPELWIAHKNLVLVEARLGRWDEFDREREVLRQARKRGAAGITARESDVIDSFEVRGQSWIAREYFEPVGRSQTRYNFEHFSAVGRVEVYVSLESSTAAMTALQREDQVRIGADHPKPTNHFALNWYTGKGHGTIAEYTGGEPSYEQVRADMLRWVKAQK